MAKIDEVITMLEKEIIRLETLDAIRVTQRIDENVGFLRNVLVVAKEGKEGQKFDLVETIGSHCTVVYKKNGTTISAGSNVLKFGDKLKITVTFDEDYELDTFTINNVAQSALEVEFTVDKDLAIVVTAKAVETEPDVE